MKTCSLLAVAALASAATGYAVTPGVTDPVGVTTLTAINQPSEAGGISFLSLNLTRPVSFEATIPAGGVSTNASGQTVITFAPGTLSTALFSTPGYVEIASGPNAGVVSDVVTATDSSITLANNVSAVASAPAGNVLLRARPHWTFVTAFGTPSPSDPAALTGGTTPASADVLTLVDALPAGAARGHYFNTTAGQWRRVSDDADASNVVIPLGVGLQVQRLSTIPAQVRLAGAVKVGATGIWINGSSAGDTVNMVSNPYPLASRRLDQLGLYNGANDPTAQASLAGGGGLNDADLVRILDPQSGVFTDFYYNTSPGPNGNRWRAGMTDASLYTIPEGASVAVIRRANRSPFVWYAPPPAMNLIPGTPPQPLTLVSAVSRRAHPGGGVNGTTFVGDINLPLAGDPGIECRAPDAAGNFTIVLTFSNPVVSAAASVGGVAAVTSINGKEVTITAGVSNAQTLTIAVNSAVDVYNQPLPAGGVSLSAGFLLGDVTASRGVNSGDTAYVRSQSGTVLNPANLRADVNASGQINSGDVGVIQQKSGTGLP